MSLWRKRKDIDVDKKRKKKREKDERLNFCYGGRTSAESVVYPSSSVVRGLATRTLYVVRDLSCKKEDLSSIFQKLHWILGAFASIKIL